MPDTYGHIIDGAEFAKSLCDDLARDVAEVKHMYGLTPKLVVVIVGDDPASAVYVKKKGEQTLSVGMLSETIKLANDTPELTLLSIIDRLNQDNSVNGILVQLPLPAHMSSLKVIEAIDPQKDVDGFHVLNAGKLSVGLLGLVPCTPLGGLMLLKDAVTRFGDGRLTGKHAVIVGRSNTVGKPMAQLLLREDCTVTIAHSKTRDLKALCLQADILVAAVGRPKCISGDMIKQGAFVIDVGINRLEQDGKSRLVGDVDFDAAKLKARAITPVPKGVGPMTIACLLANTLTAFYQQNALIAPVRLTA
jgi:methylenetetrahydrofolate dehydrogenase (NADP+) / methenyltetrahydrofolate cyclohydrolase